MPTMYDHFQPLSEEALRDLARNEAAPHLNRLTAMRILQERESAHFFHPDLTYLRDVVLRQEEPESPVTVQGGDPVSTPVTTDVSESVVPESEMLLRQIFGERLENGPEDIVPLSASVTTQSLMQDEEIQNGNES